MKIENMNEFIIDENDNVAVKLLNFLMENRDKYNLMIMATTVKEKDWKKSYEALKNSFKEKLNLLSDEDAKHLSNFSTIIRYRDAKKEIRGLSVTFGKTLESHVYETSFKHDVSDFIRNLPDNDTGLIKYASLPILRMSLLIHSMRTSLDGSEQLEPLKLDDFAMLDFNSSDWRYTIEPYTTQYMVNLISNDLRSNRFHLRVSKPTQVGKKKMANYWIFDNQATGFSLYNIQGLKLKRENKITKTNYLKTQVLGKEKDADKNREKNLSAISAARGTQEAYWMSLLRNLLNDSEVHYTQSSFAPTDEISILPDHERKPLFLYQDILGIKSDSLLNDNEFSVSYFIDPNIDFSIDEEAYSQMDMVVDAINDVHVNNEKYSTDLTINTKRVYSLDEADLVFGVYDENNTWKTTNALETLDSYGRQRAEGLKRGDLRAQQFISVKVKKADDLKSPLKRCLYEILLKKWVSQSNPKRNFVVSNESEVTENKFLILSTKTKKQNAEKKDNNNLKNIFYCCYQVELHEKGMSFSKPNVHAEYGVNMSDDENSLQFLDYYYPYSDLKLPSLQYVLDLISDNVNCEKLLELIGTRFLNNDVTLIFEYSENRIEAIWETRNHDLFITSKLEQLVTPGDTFINYVKSGIEKKAFTKNVLTSKITQDANGKQMRTIL